MNLYQRCCLVVCRHTIFLLSFLMLTQLYAKDFKMESTMYSSQTAFLALDGDFIVWYKQCKQKDYQACYFLGLAYIEGYGILPDRLKGSELIVQACKQHLLQACLALQYYYGQSSNTQAPLLNLDSLNLEYLLPYEEGCKMQHVTSCEFLAKLLIQQHQSKNTQDEEIIPTEDDSKNAVLRNQILNVLDNFCSTQNTSYHVHNPCQTLALFKTTFYHTATNQIESLIASCEKSLHSPNASRMDCAKVANAYAQGKNVPKDKSQARKYFSLACEKHKEFCYNKILDSILN